MFASELLGLDLDVVLFKFNSVFFTQSGIDVSVKGFVGLSGLGTSSGPSGFTVDLAGIPLSNHHFRRSELGGGTVMHTYISENL